MKRYPGFFDAFQQLVEIPSVSSIDPAYDQSNEPVINLLADWLDYLGMKVEIMPVTDRPGKFNLLASIGEGEGGLVLSGHTDTVPYDEHLWEYDPFKLTGRDNKFYGLGTADMKVFFPFVLELLSQLDTKKLRHPIFLLATADEESTMAGAMTLAASGKKLGRYALIGEPTGLKPVNQHKGIMIESIRVIGQAGHSSNPAYGNNALEGMHKVISGLLKLRQDMQEKYTHPAFEVPHPTINLGSIQGGDNPNRICAECELKLDVRLIPGMEIEETRASLRKAAEESIVGTGLKLEFDELYEGLPPMQTDDESRIIQLAQILSGRETTSVAFGTEGPYLNKMGMQTVVLGPGDIDVAHQANEYISLDRIKPMQTILNKLVKQICLETIV